MDYLEWIGEKVVMKTRPGLKVGQGMVVAYCPAPMVCVELASGERVWWRAELCEVEAEVASPAADNDIMEKE